MTYTKCGNYLIPDLVLSDAPKHHIGNYGRLRRAYLKEHWLILYPHLEVIDIACRERLELIKKVVYDDGSEVRQRICLRLAVPRCLVCKIPPYEQSFCYILCL
nr:TnpV protein [uncultured Agathobaculum sp.]